MSTRIRENKAKLKFLKRSKVTLYFLLTAAVTCEEFPCLNGAECEDTDDGEFLCHCRLGYMGKTCSTSKLK